MAGSGNQPFFLTQCGIDARRGDSRCRTRKIDMRRNSGDADRTNPTYFHRHALVARTRRISHQGDPIFSLRAIIGREPLP